MNIIKDLLYTKGNAALDISRSCALASLTLFWAGVFWLLARDGVFDPIAVGGGCAAIFAAAAGWIHVRQKHEGGAE